jgi:hypothetical protein
LKLSDLQIAIAVTVLTVFVGGCAGVQTTETKSLLGSAGFRELTPKTEKQKQTYAELPANKIERVAWRGTTLYIYKDAAAGVAYIGRQAEYDRYQQLCRQRHMDQDFFAAEEADPLHAHRWYGAWSPNVVWR